MQGIGTALYRKPRLRRQQVLLVYPCREESYMYKEVAQWPTESSNMLTGQKTPAVINLARSQDDNPLLGDQFCR